MARVNNRYNLSFITDDDLKAHTLATVSRFRTGMTLAEFHKNIVDPIKLTFDAHVYRRQIGDVIDAEVIRQLNKTNENLIGYFHQNIFRYIGRGWEVPDTGADGWDVENHEMNIFAEFKNKHNTMNSSAAGFTHARMRGLVEGHLLPCPAKTGKTCACRHQKRFGKSSFGFQMAISCTKGLYGP